jgi:magnesium transporter
MIRYFTTQEKKLVELDQMAGSSWIHISAPFDRNELEAFASRYDIPFDFLIDSLDIDERSRYEREDDARLIVVNTPVINKQDEENEAVYITVPIGTVLIPDGTVTISAFDNPVIQSFLDDRVKGLDVTDERMFVLRLFEENVKQFLSALKNLNLKRNLIEKELMDSSRNRELKQLLKIEKALVYFVNTLSSNELLKMKMKRTDFLEIKGDEEMQDFFEDIIIDNSQALEMSNVYTNILNGTMEAYASIISNNLNVVIQRLTLITIILMVPTLVASYYGMNVDLPLKDHPWAFVIIIFLSIILSLFLAIFFRRKRLF